ncbi:MAG: HlyD family efflux transporter periplasmic adaptor subunit [Hyphomicrobium sp.]|nr:HlyD family efflux transporter periplasmic adaptor subunit [Hyphomicrobium sp.]
MRRSFCIFLLILSSLSPVLAGPGHDHGEGGHGQGGHGQGGHGPETAAPAAVPRLESSSSDFELVATAEGHRLTIYLDRFDSNEPLDGASLEVSGEGIFAAAAKPVAPGTYVVDADWLDVPGSKPLLFTITTSDTSDLLNGTLTIADTAPVTQSTTTPLADVLTRPGVLAALLGALVAGFLIALALRPRSSSSPCAPQSSTPQSCSSDAPQAKSTGNLRAAAEIIVVTAFAGFVWASPVLAGPGHDGSHDHGDGGNAPATIAAGNAPRKLADGSVFIPKPSQRLLDVRTHPAVEETSVKSRELMGTIISDPSAFGQVQAPMDGQIEMSERGISFAGQKVEAGEVLALLSPAIPLADLGTMQQLRAEVDGKLIIAEQKLARLTRIAGVVAQRDIDDTRAERDALREQKRVLAPKGIEKVALKAPVSGIISLANVRAGQVVSARDTLFEIVDPNRLWAEGIGNDIHNDDEIASAEALDRDGHAFKLTYMGRAPTLRQQAQPFLFRVDQRHAGLAIGAPVKILVQTPDAARGYVLPGAAIVRGSNGLPQVWVKLSAERFKPVAVKIAPLDGTRSLVIAGIEAGQRVVTAGAELINQIR